MKRSTDQLLRQAKIHAKNGEHAEAVAFYNKVLTAYPKNKRAQQGLAELTAKNVPDQAHIDALITAFNQGGFNRVVEGANTLLEQFPHTPVLYNLLGAAHASQGHLDEAIHHFQHLLDLAPDSSEAYNNIGNVFKDKGQWEEAENAYAQALKLNSSYIDAYNNLGLVHIDQGRYVEAIKCFEQTIHLAPGHMQAVHNLAISRLANGEFAKAVEHFASVLSQNPNAVASLLGQSEAYQKMGELNKARACLQRAQTLSPQRAEVYLRLAEVLYLDGQLSDAEQNARQALASLPGQAQPYNLLGAIEMKKQRTQAAIDNFLKAVELAPDFVDAHNNLGAAYSQAGIHAKAIEHFTRSLALDEQHAQTHNNLGIVYLETGDTEKAIDCFKRAVDLKPDYDGARAHLFLELSSVCDWDAIARDRDRFMQLGLRNGSVSPFHLLALEDNPSHHRQRAESYAREHYERSPMAAPERPAEVPKRLRIAYVSSDFYNHATMYLMASLFQAHDRDKFEIFAYSYGQDTQDAMREKLERTVDVFHNVRGLSDDEIAEKIRRDGIDIAIELKGHTTHARLGIFAYRPAPVQMHYLGYPGTTGCSFLDYLIADEVVIPPSQQQHYSENIIYLPDSYQANDNTRRISEEPQTRSMYGLPEDSFVFCCFNNSYKISPDEFDIWCRLLVRIPNSVLWLLKTNDKVSINLSREAEKRGVDPKRLIFANRVPLDQHLARHQLADLFLDTFNINAHTTASDALWAGLPLITKCGEDFAARVSASLLTALNLEELITSTPETYEQLAIEFATSPEKLAAIKMSLHDNRLLRPLFDTEKFVGHLEQAFVMAYERYFKGEEPQTFHVPRNPR